jgi:hypothetical protein
MESASTATSTRAPGEPAGLALGSWLMLLAAAGFAVYAVIFFIRNFTDEFLELGIGPAQVDVGRDQIQQFSPQLLDYIGHLHIAVSGFILGTAVGVAFLVWFGMRRGQLWAWIGAVAAPVLALAVAIPSHYPYGLDTIGHLGLIYLAVAIFVVGALVSLRPLLRARP